MSHDYNYRPKFVDIRVRKPPSTARVAEGPLCQHAGCKQAATHRAPKARDRLDDLWQFCKEHAALYNANWDYFAGMTEEEYQGFEAGEAFGQKQKWRFAASVGNSTRFAGLGEDWVDPLAAIRELRAKQNANAKTRAQKAPQPILTALGVLGLTNESDKKQVRDAYHALVRRFHPDSNGGDRSAEARFTEVVKAYKMLKTARRA